MSAIGTYRTLMLMLSMPLLEVKPTGGAVVFANAKRP